MVLPRITPVDLGDAAGLKIFTTTLAMEEGLSHAALRNGLVLFLFMVIITCTGRVTGTV